MSINKEISILNNDLSQVSCKLFDKYLGYINISVIYMIWKCSIDNKRQEKKEMLKRKESDREKQWDKFKKRTSNDEKIEVKEDVHEFIKEFIGQVREKIVDEKKKEYMARFSQKFKNNKELRKMIQGSIDVEVFSFNSSEDSVVDYILNPK